jgi:hypothetical protein
VSKRYVLRIENDCDTESPFEWAGDDGWRFCSFSRRHTSFVHPDELDLKSISMRRKFACGTAFFLSYYEHGLCRWSLLGGGPRCQWDTVDGAGVLIWQGKASNLGADYVERAKRAESMLEAYTDWCNGACYWYSLDEVDENGDEVGCVDSCGGFIGDEHLRDTLVSEVLAGIDERAEFDVKGDCAFVADGKRWLKGGLPAAEADRIEAAAQVGGGI